MMARIVISAVIAVIVLAAFFGKSPEKPSEIPVAAATAPPTKPAAPTRCAAADFAVEGFASRVVDECRASSCPSLKLTGRLKNNCTLPAGAQLKIVAEDKAGNVVDTVEGWPASTRNLAPGQAYAFDLGPLLTYRKEMARFTVQVIAAQTWR